MDTQPKTETAADSQNVRIAKDAALTGLPTFDKSDEPTKAQRDKWQRDYAAQRDGALKLVSAVNSLEVAQ